jgi:hypothetical protein
VIFSGEEERALFRRTLERVFPAWPKEQNAEFESLRAQGGFLVSAEQKDGKVTKLQIASTIGGKLRLLDPWTGKFIERETQPREKLEINLETRGNPHRPVGGP